MHFAWSIVKKWAELRVGQPVRVEWPKLDETTGKYVIEHKPASIIEVREDSAKIRFASGGEFLVTNKESLRASRDGRF